MDPLAPKVLILREHWDQMREDVIQRDPEEACGLVAGLENCSQRVFTIPNILHSPTRFKLDPQLQLEALLMIDEYNWDLLAIYHSHPVGPPFPSATDIREASYPEAVHLIWYPYQEDWSCRGFLIDEGMYKEILLGILDRQQGK